MLLSLLLVGCSGSDSSVNPEPEPPTTGENTNANDPVEGKSFVTDYSMPHLNPENYYVEHTVTYDGKKILNYAYEWVKDKKHTAWVAFSFDETTSQKNVSRSDDAWATDLELPGGWCPEESNHKSDGFDKGHLCASEDRVYSKEANAQTFYYSNMSPQMSSFNGGFWASFEILVQKWARSGAYDKVYVVKGGTADQLLVNLRVRATEMMACCLRLMPMALPRKDWPVPNITLWLFLAKRERNITLSVLDGASR